MTKKEFQKFYLLFTELVKQEVNLTVVPLFLICTYVIIWLYAVL